MRRQFRAARERYRTLGVPYHRGYLLYGPPGTGKDVVGVGLAAKFGMSIYAVNLTELNDQEAEESGQCRPENSVILFEDIDCMKVGGARRSPTTGRKTRRAQEARRAIRRIASESHSQDCLMSWRFSMLRRTFCS